ncbi:MAG: hypothetical protein ACRD6N_20205 [Pyrinomonadaceae bacterium]
MKIRIFCLLLAAATVIAQSPVALAQGAAGQWSAVQAIAADERLIVKQKDGKTIAGRMIEASETNLSLSRNNKVVNIPRDGIRQIQHSTGKAAKGKWAAIGAGIGAGTGAGIGAAKYSPDRDDSEIWISVGTVFGAGAGAIAGLLIGASRRKRTLIYQAP